MDSENAQNGQKPFVPQNPFGVNQRYWERIQAMQLMDDTLMRAAFHDNIEAVQFVLRTILDKKDLHVTRSRTQVEYKNLYGHSLFLDVDAVDSDMTKYDIEIQRVLIGAYAPSPERGRYHSSVIDANSLQPGQKFSDLPTVYVIFITEDDYWGKGQGVYHVKRTIQETGEDYEDRSHILYVNGSYEGDDPVGRLMADFRQSDPGKMHSRELADRVAALKYSEEGVRNMCRAMEITFQEGLSEGRILAYAGLIEERMNEKKMSMYDAMEDLRIPQEYRQSCVDFMAQGHQKIA